MNILQNERQNNNKVGTYSCETISCSTKYRYRTLSFYHLHRTMRLAAQQKNRQRYAVENPMLSSISYLFTIITSHCLIGPPDTPLHREPLQALIKGVAQLRQLVSTSNYNLHMRSLLPGISFLISRPESHISCMYVLYYELAFFRC